MPIIRPNRGYLRKYSPLTPLPLTPLRVPMIACLPSARCCLRSTRTLWRRARHGISGTMADYTEGLARIMDKNYMGVSEN